jgi:predicted MPP superfamily phosphohydrolase
VWFVYVGVGLILLVVSGIYARRRIAGALEHFGVRPGRVRAVRWAIAWLLFGFPVLVIVSIVGSRLLGQATLPRFDGLIASWLLAMPFAWSMLVVFQSVPWLIAIDLARLLVRRRRGAATAERLRAIGVLAVAGVFAVYTPARILVERGDVRVRHHQVGAAAPASTNAAPFRIAFIADIQQDIHTDGDRAREIYAIVNASQPDVVLSGGDWINTGPDHIAAAADAAATLKSRLGTFSVRGDHEHFAYVDRQRSVAEVEQAMQGRGIAMLNNEVRSFEHHGKRIAILFINYNYIFRTDRETIARLVASMAGADYRIAVTHQLDRSLAALLEGKVDLVLGAHTHGGQVNPVVGVRHVELARLETDFIDGRYQLGATTIIITAGVGYSVVPFRYAAPGSIELIELAL